MIYWINSSQIGFFEALVVMDSALFSYLFNCMTIKIDAHGKVIEYFFF